MSQYGASSRGFDEPVPHPEVDFCHRKMRSTILISRVLENMSHFRRAFFSE